MSAEMPPTHPYLTPEARAYLRRYLTPKSVRLAILNDGTGVRGAVTSNA